MLELWEAALTLRVGASGLLGIVLIDSGVVVVYEGSLDMLFSYPGSFRRGGGGDICGGTGVYTMVFRGVKMLLSCFTITPVSSASSECRTR